MYFMPEFFVLYVGEFAVYAVTTILVRRPAEAVGAGVRAAAVAVDRVIEAHVRALVVRDDRARLRLLEDLDASLGRLADPLDRVREPGVWRVIDVTHQQSPSRLIPHRPWRR
jgi:hypothetical protein